MHWQNIVLVLGIKGVFLVLTLLGTASMWQAVFADTVTGMVVIANGLRLLLSRPSGWALGRELLGVAAELSAYALDL